ELTDGDLDHDLGLGPGDEDPLVDEQIECAEPPPPEHVLEGLTRGPPLDHVVEERDGALRYRFVEGQKPVGTLTPRRPFDNAPGLDVGPEAFAGERVQVAPCHGRAGRRRRVANLGLELSPGHVSGSSPRSWRARSSAARASTSSSNSPCRTRSSFFRVSPM